MEVFKIDYTAVNAWLDKNLPLREPAPTSEFVTHVLNDDASIVTFECCFQLQRWREALVIFVMLGANGRAVDYWRREWRGPVLVLAQYTNETQMLRDWMAVTEAEKIRLFALLGVTIQSCMETVKSTH